MNPILILTAVEFEARRLARDLELPPLRAHAFPVFGRGPVRLAPVGLGASFAGSRWSALVDGLGRPFVISAGVCGGLDPRLLPGDLVLPERVITASGADLRIDPGAHRTAVARSGGAVATGALLTTRDVVAAPADKAALFAATGAVAVDMESAIIVEKAAGAGLIAVVIRAIVDSAGQNLPLELARLVTPDGRVRLARAVALAVAHPGTVPIAFDLRRRTRRALGAVARALSGLIG